MSDVYSPVLRQLAKLGRRNVEEDEELLDESPLDIGALDLSGLRQPNNDPIPDIENGGSIPQRYDVRANSVMMPVDPETMQPIGQESQQSEGFNSIPKDTYRSLGRNIPKYGGEGPEAYKKSYDEAMSLPPNYDVANVEPPLNSVPKRPDFPQTYKYMGKEIPRFGGQEVDANQQNDRNAAIEGADPVPADIVYGSTDKVASSPELKMQFETITGMPMTDEMTQATKAYEQLLSDIEDPMNTLSGEYDEQMEAAKNRILANQPTDMDKFYVGLALLMPAILGGAFGKEVGLASLGGGLQGFAKGIEGRQKAISTESDRLADITNKKAVLKTKQGELQIEKMKVPESIRKSFPDESAHLKGLRKTTLKDPKTGEDTNVIELKPSLVIPEQYVANKHSLEAAQKTATDIAEMRGSTLEFANTAKEFTDLLSKVQDKDLLGRIMESIALKKAPSFAVSQVKKVEHKGKMINPYLEIVQLSKKMEDQYRRQNNIRASLVGSDVSDKLTPNIFEAAITPEDAIDAVINLDQLMGERFLSAAEAQGFYREPLESDLGKIRRDMYQTLNKASEKKESGKGLAERRYKGAK